MASCAFVTFGCKINQYDTQAIREQVLALGFEEREKAVDLDLVVVNSCTVTAVSGDKVEARVRKLARYNPGAAIVVTGCITDEDRVKLAAIEGVDHVVGNEEKDRIIDLVQSRELPPRKSRRNSQDIFNLEVSGLARRTRAFLKVQDGCDSFCSYCVIPYLRGGSRSRPVDDVLAEARRFARGGIHEVVITGIHLREYGGDLGQGAGLGELLVGLREIEGIDRVRLSSIGEGAFSDRFLDHFSADEGLCRFFHIPLQSGSDAVLQRMGRDYDRQVFLETLEKVKSVLPDCIFATDLMVGFPGETESEFEESLDLCRQAGFLQVHLFPYSVRPRTRASRLPDHLPRALVEDRIRHARKVVQEIKQQQLQQLVGRQVKVLIEKTTDRYSEGLSREGLRVAIPAGKESRNQELDVRLEEAQGERLLGARIGGGDDH